MKTIWQYIAIAALAVSAAACTPEFPIPNQAGLPQASDLDVNIVVDQETNYVTFVMNNKGVVPVWIFGDQKIDGKASKKYSYTDNNVTLRFREAGEHTVEVKAYNANGISQGSLVKTFTLDNTYRDPFDPSPYVKAVSNGSSQTWIWNSAEAGHIACGPAGDPKGWWQVEPNGKKGFLYDDLMTFASDGTYTYDPVDGQAYAKKDAEYPAGHAVQDDDYLFPAEKKTTKFTFENNWNDAGIEEIFLVLDPGSILSYVVHKSLVDEPRYQILETKTSAMKKKLQFMATASTPTNADGISFYYEFVPEGSIAGADDPLFGKESKAWVLDNESAGYMGCGGSLGNPLEWWSAQPHEKDAFGVTDDVLTFFKDGKYVFDPGADGVVYCNWESDYHHELWDGGQNSDYDAPAEVQTSTYTLGSDADGDYIELPAGIFFSYVANKAILSEPTRLYVTELTETKMVLVAKFNGICWQLIFKPRDGAPVAEDPLFGVTSKTWVYDNESAGYLGCGGSLGNPTEWWSGGPHEKDAYGVKDDELTFFADGKYTFNPGADGVVYCNWESNYHHELWDGGQNSDYDAPADAQEATYTLDSDDDGDYIELPAGIFFGYVPNKAVLETPTKLYIKENTKDKLVVVAKFDGICWQMIFRPKEGQGGGGQPGSLDEALVGTWTWDPDQNGHFGCGPDLGNPLGWWNGEAHCKDNAHMYDDTITFTADGKYTLDPVDGFSYMNKDVTFLNDRKGDSPYGDDFLYTNEKTTWSFTLDEENDLDVIKLADGGLFSYIPNNAFEDEPWLYVKSCTADQLVLMTYTATGNNGGSIAWQYVFKRVK